MRNPRHDDLQTAWHFGGGKNARGMTLVEIVIGLIIIGVLAGITVPAVQSLGEERQAREPVRELVRLARTVRAKAIAEQRSYQITFDETGFHALQFYNAYSGPEEIENLKNEAELDRQRQELIEATRARMGDLAGVEEDQPQAAEIDPYFLESYTLPEGVRCSVKFWGETEFEEVTGGRYVRWIFQPSGMCNPLSVQIQADSAFFEVTFHPLTADIISEQSYVE